MFIKLQSYQINKLIEIVKDFHWMARRYVDGRSTYAPSLFNDHVRALQQMGIELNPGSDNTIWANDGMDVRQHISSNEFNNERKINKNTF